MNQVGDDVRNTITSKDLYNALSCRTDLHSIPEIHENELIWHLYKNAYVRAYCDSYDACIEIISTEYFNNNLIHWHPDECEMFEELYSLGKKGNMLVLKKPLFGTSVFFKGSLEEYPFSHKREFYFGKKKWDAGRLIYLEQK